MLLIPYSYFRYFTLFVYYCLLIILLLKLEIVMIAWLFLYVDILKLLIAFFSLVLNIFLNLSKFFNFIYTSKKFVMAILTQGILGGISGKIGNVVGSSWKGIATLRTKALSIANPRTTAQVTQREKFSLCVSVATVLLSNVIIPLWNRFAVKMSGYNSFVKKNIAAFTGVSLAYPNLFFTSVGKMTTTLFVAVVNSVDATLLSVSWSGGVAGNFQSATDIPYVVVITDDGTVLFSGNAGVARSDNTANLTLSEAVDPGVSTYVYLSFSRVDYTVVSNSEYVSL